MAQGVRRYEHPLLLRLLRDGLSGWSLTQLCGCPPLGLTQWGLLSGVVIQFFLPQTLCRLVDVGNLQLEVSGQKPSVLSVMFFFEFLQGGSSAAKWRACSRFDIADHDPLSSATC